MTVNHQRVGINPRAASVQTYATIAGTDVALAFLLYVLLRSVHAHLTLRAVFFRLMVPPRSRSPSCSISHRHFSWEGRGI